MQLLYKGPIKEAPSTSLGRTNANPEGASPASTTRLPNVQRCASTSFEHRALCSNTHRFTQVPFWAISGKMTLTSSSIEFANSTLNGPIALVQRTFPRTSYSTLPCGRKVPAPTSSVLYVVLVIRLDWFSCLYASRGDELRAYLHIRSGSSRSLLSPNMADWPFATPQPASSNSV